MTEFEKLIIEETTRQDLYNAQQSYFNTEFKTEKLTFEENAVVRTVYHDVNSGGSFGANPLEAHIGIGSAIMIKSIEIRWPVGNYVQVFENIPPDSHLKIKEGVQTIVSSKPRMVHFSHEGHDIMKHDPK